MDARVINGGNRRVPKQIGYTNISVNLMNYQLKVLDDWQERGIIGNRTEAIRAAIDDYIEKKQKVLDIAKKSII